ncbi:MAG: NUDIX hydrolase, partial [Desulfurococcales archaeon]|nr:NUDIX hydrolase [Desulfurococcales archaeon]
EEVMLPNGKKMLVDRVIFPEAVAVLPVLEDGTAVLVWQYRPVIDKFILEAPAGVLRTGESPEEAALREMEEETGYRGGDLVRVGSAYTSPGYSTEKLHLYVALGPKPGEARPEEHEIIRVKRYGLRELAEMALRGELEDLKTIALVLAARRILGGESEA